METNSLSSLHKNNKEFCATTPEQSISTLNPPQSKKNKGSFFSDGDNLKEKDNSHSLDNNKEGDHDILKFADLDDELKMTRSSLKIRLSQGGVKMEGFSEGSYGADFLTSKIQTLAPSQKAIQNNKEPLIQPLIPNKTEDIKLKSQEAIKFIEATKKENQVNQDNKNTNLPEMRGYLQKQSPGILHVWQKRYVLLKEKKLMYFQTEMMDEMKGCLDFSLIDVQMKASKSDSKVFKLKPDGCERSFVFKTSTENETQNWMNALSTHLKASEDDRKGQLSNIVSKKNFWKYDRISEERFLSESKTGDLLLFTSHSWVAKLQRSVTRSKYDHIALILKLSDKKIVLFEATGNEGVGLCRWTTFKNNGWHILYDRVVYRKLEVERTKDFIEKIERFVKNAVGKRYSCNAQKLMLRKSVTINEEIPNDRTFFCSELVAACYKRAGLLPDEIPSSHYLPSSFATTKMLTLLGGAKLEDEKLIDFSLI